MQADGSFVIELDNVEKIAIRRLAKVYAINYADMLVSCIYKGIDVIGVNVKDGDNKERPWCHG